MPQLGLSTLRTIGSISSHAVIEEYTDYFFELSSGELQPRATISDLNDSWDLDGNSDITPATSPASGGYWDIDGNGDIMPEA